MDSTQSTAPDKLEIRAKIGLPSPVTSIRLYGQLLKTPSCVNLRIKDRQLVPYRGSRQLTPEEEPFANKLCQFLNKNADKVANFAEKVNHEPFIYVGLNGNEYITLELWTVDVNIDKFLRRLAAATDCVIVQEDGTH